MFKKCKSPFGKKKLTRAEQKQLRPGQILDAALIEFVKNGYAATRVEDIADHVGVTKGTVYVYFETKEVLFEATIRHASTSFADLVTNAKDDQGTACERLKSLLHAMYESLFNEPRNRDVLKLVIAEGEKFPDIVARHDQEVIKPLIDYIENLVETGVAAGEFRMSSVVLPELIISPLMTQAVLQIMFSDENRCDLRQLCDAHIDLLMNGLKT